MGQRVVYQAAGESKCKQEECIRKREAFNERFDVMSLLFNRAPFSFHLNILIASVERKVQ